MVNEFNIEDISDEDITNLDEVETVIYTPNIEDEDLECSDEVYNRLEYYDLEWPSQTVSTYKSKYIVIGTNAENEPSKLKLLDVDKIGHDDFKVTAITSEEPYNRIRTNTNINCVSDKTFDVYNENLIKLDSILFDNMDYGLCSTNNCSIFAHSKGQISIYTDRIQETISLHTGSINSISFYNSLIYTASSDKSIKVTDLRSRDLVFTKTENSEVNAIDTNKDNLFVFGDDFGSIKLLDIRMPENEVGIFWHKSSISMITWKDSDMFVSASDEQVCIFDTSLEDDWEYEKYLLFVHQGQKQYKDVCFIDNLIITTSIEGLCMFTPISLSE